MPVLAILVVITTYLQSKLMTPPTANPKDQTAQMTGMMNLYMPIFMGWLAFTLSSGLSLYFVVSNVFGIIAICRHGKGKLEVCSLLRYRNQSQRQSESR